MRHRVDPYRATAMALILISLTTTGAAAQPTPPDDDATAFVEAWMELWNGRTALAERLIAEEFTLHATMLDGSESSAIDSPQAFAAWVAASREAFPDLVFVPTVGPMLGSSDGTAVSIAVHWEATGTYAGGIPLATASPSTAIGFSGTDVVRLAEGQVTDYWLVTDTLAMLNALGIEAPVEPD